MLINNGTFFGRTIQAARVTKLYRTSLVRKNSKYCDNRVTVGEDLQLTFSVLATLSGSVSFRIIIRIITGSTRAP